MNGVPLSVLVGVPRPFRRIARLAEVALLRRVHWGRATWLGARAFGRVKAVHDFGAGDILEIDPGRGAPTWYLPFTREAVPEVQISSGRITAVRPLEDEAEDADPA